MISSSWFWLAIIGIILSAIGGFGLHLLTNFRGRALEAYSRLRARRNRFGQILDQQTDASIGCNYLFLFGASLSALSIGTLCQRLLSQSSNVNEITEWYFLFAMSLGVAAILAFVHSWFPKICIQNSASVILFHTWWMWRLIAFASSPLRALESLFLSLGYRLSDRRADERFAEESLEDEIRTLMIAGERTGLVTSSMRDMISGVMNLDEGVVSQIMTARSKVDAIDLNWDWDQILDALARSGRTRLPVYEGSLDHVVGILFVKDVLSHVRKSDDFHSIGTNPINVRDMIRDAWLVPGSMKIDQLLKDFLVRRNHMAVVIDEFQQTIGVVTIEDALEEIVGEIADELDVEVHEPEFREESGGFSVSAGMEVAAANRAMSLELPESDDYETIAGLLISRLGHIPRVGGKSTVGSYKISVVQATPRQVLRVRIEVM